MFYQQQESPARDGGARQPPHIRRGPAQALYERRTRNLPANPSAFCMALLGPLAYALPEDVDAATWRLALEHFARKAPPDGEFRRLLEQRARARPEDSRTTGTRVAAFLLREWERYGVARLLGAGPSRRGRKQRGASGRRAGVPNAPRALRLALRGAGASQPSAAAPGASADG